MSEKKQSATETTEKIVTKYDKKVQRRKEAEKRAQIERKRNRIIGAVIALVFVCFIAYFPISNYMATHSTYMKVGEYDVTQVEFDYYYNLGVNSYVSQYGSLLSYMGLDVSQDLSTQNYSEYMTWDDYFQQYAATNLTQTKALLDLATAEGFTYDATADADNQIALIEESAASAEMSVSDYVKASFGRYATTKNLREVIEESFYASAYYDQVAEGKVPSEEEIAAYYAENVDSYDSVDYRLIQVEAEIPEGETTTDAEGNETTTEPTEEQIAAAMEAAKTLADETVATVSEEGELQENIKRSSVNSLYREWMFAAERQEGDTTVVEDTTNNRYYVLEFVSRYLDDTKTVDIRVIMTAEDLGETIVEEWNQTGANEDAFLALVEKYSEDTYTNTTGGLYEAMTASALSEELSTWLLDDARQAGDVTNITATDGNTYVMYFVGWGDPEWSVSISSTLQSEAMGEYMTEITEPFTVTDVRGRLTYLAAIAAEESAAAAESEAAESAAQESSQNTESSEGTEGTESSQAE